MRKTYKSFRCPVCNRDFLLEAYKANKRLKQTKGVFGAQLYCSRKCSALNRSAKTEATVVCESCGKQIIRKQSACNLYEHVFCNRACAALYKKTKAATTYVCGACGRSFTRPASYARSKIYNQYFCSRRCSASVKHKSNKAYYGRSKLEVWLENQLSKQFPELRILYNDRRVLGGKELDIYIPSLQLAFELNGPMHYQPIFGEERLQSQQQSDSAKLALAGIKQLNFYVLDVSTMRYFKEAKAKAFLDLIAATIDCALSSGA